MVDAGEMLEKNPVKRGVFPEREQQADGNPGQRQPGEAVTLENQRQRQQQPGQQSHVITGLGKEHPAPVIGTHGFRVSGPLLP
ncbi:MAG TPA: hypothetical protein DCZ63_11575 [Geobacter sp.]|nr:hypothetical protein [Geobacter sp.]